MYKDSEIEDGKSKVFKGKQTSVMQETMNKKAKCFKLILQIEGTVCKKLLSQNFNCSIQLCSEKS